MYLYISSNYDWGRRSQYPRCTPWWHSYHIFIIPLKNRNSLVVYGQYNKSVYRVTLDTNVIYCHLSNLICWSLMCFPSKNPTKSLNRIPLVWYIYLKILILNNLNVYSVRVCKIPKTYSKFNFIIVVINK